MTYLSLEMNLIPLYQSFGVLHREPTYWRLRDEVALKSCQPNHIARSICHDLLIVSVWEKTHQQEVYFDLDALLRHLSHPEDRRFTAASAIHLAARREIQIVERRHPAGFMVKQLRISDDARQRRKIMRKTHTYFPGYEPFYIKLWERLQALFKKA